MAAGPRDPPAAGRRTNDTIRVTNGCRHSPARAGRLLQYAGKMETEAGMAEASDAFDNPGVTTMAHRTAADAFPWPGRRADDRRFPRPALAVA